MLRIHLLGHLQILADGSQWKLTARPKTLPLWAYLLLHRAGPVSREAVTFTLWPDETETAARANLRRHLHELQRKLPPASPNQPWLLVDAAEVQWNPAADFWLDVAEFERLSGEDGSLAGAVALYAGDLLQDVYEDWLFYERERLRALYQADLAQLIRIGRSCGDYARAIAWAQQLLRHDPLHEDAMRQLLALRYESGDRAGAVAEYHRFVQLLRQELGVDPMPETAALYEAIVRSARLPGAVVIPPSLPGGEAETQPGRGEDRSRRVLPFAGRGPEMEQLRVAWSRAARGHGSLVLVGGEAGVGKTRLAAELAAAAESQGARVLVGGTTFAEPMPYQAVIEALHSVLPLLATPSLPRGHLSAVAPLLPELKARLPDLPPLPRLDAAREQVRLFEALARCLVGLAQPRPMLLILEDLHWAGAATIALLTDLAGRVGQHALLILGTYREEEVPRSHPLRSLRRRLQARSVSHLALSRLPASAVAMIVHQVLGPDQAEALGRHFYEESEGNPLFLSELIRDWLESGQVEAEDGLWRAAPPAGAVPASLQATIAGRVARLSEPAQALAQTAAVIGPAFDVELLREVSGWDEAQTLDALHELLDRQLVREAGGRTLSNYAFTHHLIQTALYARLPDAARARKHRRVAQIMQELYPQRQAEWAAALAAHLDRGRDAAAAIPCYLTTARRAAAVSADDEALAAVARALELGAEAQARFDLLALREGIAGRRGERHTQQADLAEMERLAADLRDDGCTCEVLRRQVALHHALGEREAEAALVARLVECAAASGQPAWQAEALLAGAQHLIPSGQYDAAVTALEQALALYRSQADTGGQVRCYSLLATIATERGQLDRVPALVEQAQALATAGGDYSTLGEPAIQALHAAAQAAFRRNDFAASQALQEQRLALCLAIQDRAGEADAHLNLGVVAMRFSRYKDARLHFSQAESLSQALGLRENLARVAMNTGAMWMLLGRFSLATDYIGRAEALARELHDARGQVIAAINLGGLANLQGDFAAGQAAAQRALDLARALKSQMFEAYALGQLGSAACGLGQFDQAITHLRAAVALYRTTGGLATDLCLDLSDLTIAQLRAGQLGAARQTMAEMLALYAEYAERVREPQRILWAAAQTHRAAGDLARAAELLAQAYALLQAQAESSFDSESRQAQYGLPFNREILQAHDHGLWP
ncbi:MAG: ATP-binding protein [Chloroflexota bacterium]